MSYKVNGIWQVIDSFTIPKPTKWARVLDMAAYKTDDDTGANGTFPAANQCAGSDLGIILPSSASTYFFSKYDFTNTPVLTTNDTLGYFSRDADSTFMGEWGNLFEDYSGSKFNQKNVVWTKDIFNINKYFVVHTADGDQSYLPLTDHNVVAVCSN